MVLPQLADTVTRAAEGVGQAVSETLFEPVIRLGVTGLSRAGKTVFITSLVTNLLERGRMHGVAGIAQGRVEAAYLQPQPDDTVPRFAYEAHLARLTGEPPAWPSSTRSISELRLSLRIRPSGLLGAMTGPQKLHLDIVDYPGEWLLDLALMDMSYAAWSRAAITTAKARTDGAAFLAAIDDITYTTPMDEARAGDLAALYTRYLLAARAAGYSDCSPGRFLMPGDLEGSPALTFIPLEAGQDGRAARGTLLREMERRFAAYKAQVVKPFFRDHFARLDRQIVLVDVLGAISSGPPAIADMRGAMAGILSAFRHGRNSWLSRIAGRRVERILFAATKADHLHHSQHPELTAITDALLSDARARADFAGARTRAISLAAIRATVETRLSHQGRDLDCVKGVLNDTGKAAAFYPGALPDDPGRILRPAADGAERWLDEDYQIMRFAPPAGAHKPGGGLAHIRMDQAVEFLIGDKLI